MQDDLSRGSEILVVGPAFIMEEANQLIKGTFNILGSISQELEQIGIDGFQMLELVHEHSKEWHMKNLLQEEVIIYDVMKEMIRETYGGDTLLPIQAGLDCVDPDWHQVMKMYKYIRQKHDDRGQEWLMASLRHLKRNLGSGQPLCFRIKQGGSSGSRSNHVTDNDQDILDEFLPQNAVNLTKHAALSNRSFILKKPQWKRMAESYERSWRLGKIPHSREQKLKNAILHSGVHRSKVAAVYKEVSSAAFSLGWTPLKRVWQEALEQAHAGEMLKKLNICDLFRIIGPGQWKGDIVPVPRGIYKNKEAAQFMQKLWAKGFVGPTQI